MALFDPTCHGAIGYPQFQCGPMGVGVQQGPKPPPFQRPNAADFPRRHCHCGFLFVADNYVRCSRTWKTAPQSPLARLWLFAWLSFARTDRKGERLGPRSGLLVWRARLYRGRAGFTFQAHPHMLRHACGYKLANDGVDTRALQHYLGHKNIQHTVRYTELAPDRFKGFWKD
jgi:Phage integrase family